MADGKVVARKSELGLRTISAVVMLAVAGTALWLGGWAWTAFVVFVALGVLWEWRCLAAGFTPAGPARGLWNTAGILYVTAAAAMLLLIRMADGGVEILLTILGTVMAIDVGAYFSGRTFGGPKIAPAISPSKTWAGLAGGAIGAVIVLFVGQARMGGIGGPAAIVGLGVLAAIVAQAGDFFESWMKRHAGVKDSGKLIPGHGGLFDRVDGLLAVLFGLGILSLVFGRFPGMA